jgi:protein TonB
MPISPARGAGAAALSLFVHLVIVAVVVVGLPRARKSGGPEPADRERTLTGIVWIPQPGGMDENHGGGGSGNHTPAPPGRIELPGHDALTVPAGKPTPAPLQPPAAVPADAAPAIAQLDISALATAAGAITRPGVIDGVLGSLSLGPGTGGRAGSGDGSGEGPGRGPGRGPGSGGNEGGGPKKLGTPGLRESKVLHEVKPIYTADAMRARLQGTAIVEAIVLPDGTVGEAHVVKSVDSTFGLDQEALKAARKWLFQPGTIKGQPVAVLVWIELAFALR